MPGPGWRTPPAGIAKAHDLVIVTRNEQHFVPIGVGVLSPDEAGGFHAVWVTGNWRIIFRFVDGDAYDLDHLDYH